MKEEIWKDIYFIDNGIIYDYRGLYQVSNLGRIKRLDSYFFNRFKNVYVKGHIVKLYKNKKGYLKCHLTKNAKRKTFSVHRLVAQAFISNPNNLPQVDHINNNKEDNRAINLQWITNEDNMKKSWITGTRSIEKTYKRGSYNCHAKKVIQYSLDMKQIKVWGSIIDIERELGFNNRNICACCRNKRPTAYGYVWRYLN